MAWCAAPLGPPYRWGSVGGRGLPGERGPLWDRGRGGGRTPPRALGDGAASGAAPPPPVPLRPPPIKVPAALASCGDGYRHPTDPRPTQGGSSGAADPRPGSAGGGTHGGAGWGSPAPTPAPLRASRPESQRQRSLTGSSANTFNEGVKSHPRAALAPIPGPSRADARSTPPSRSGGCPVHLCARSGCQKLTRVQKR